MGLVGCAGRSSTEKTNSMLGMSELVGAARMARYMALSEASAFWRLMLSTRKVSRMYSYTWSACAPTAGVQGNVVAHLAVVNHGAHHALGQVEA